MIRPLTLTPVSAIEVDTGLWEFTWPDGKTSRGLDEDLHTLQFRHAKARQLPFPVIRMEDQ